MYRCKRCNSMFGLPGLRRESRGECFGAPAMETICVCPDCGSDDIRLARRVSVCPRCGWEVDDPNETIYACPECGYEGMRITVMEGNLRCLRPMMSL